MYSKMSELEKAAMSPADAPQMHFPYIRRDVSKIREYYAPLDAIGASSGRAPKVCIKQVGDAIALGGLSENWMQSANLSDASFFCNGPSRAQRVLSPENHPRIIFKYPLRDVHVKLVDKSLAKSADDTEDGLHVVWEADFLKGSRGSKVLQASSRPDGGSHTRFELLCPKPGERKLLELSVTGDDPSPGDTEDRSMNETVRLEIRLSDPDGSCQEGRLNRSDIAGELFRLGLGPHGEHLHTDEPIMEASVPMVPAVLFSSFREISALSGQSFVVRARRSRMKTFL